LQLTLEPLSQQLARYSREYRRRHLEEGSRYWKPQQPPQNDQIGAYLSTVPVQLVEGGNRSGKTELGVVKSIHYCTGIHPTLSPLRQPPIYGRYVGKNWDESIEVIIKKFYAMVRRDDLLGYSWETAWSPGKGVLRFCLDKRRDVPGSKISFLTSAQNVQAHAGDDLDFVVMDEHHEHKYFIENMARLVDRGGWMMLTETPDLGRTWEDKEITEKIQNGSPRHKGWRFNSTLNPHLSKDGLEMLIDSLGGDEALYKCKILGIPTALSGLVYPMFNPNLHVIDDEAVPHKKFVHRQIIVDPHLRKPTAILWIGWTKDGFVYAYREAKWSPNAGGIADLASLIRTKSAGDTKINDWIMDEALGGNPDDESRNVFGEKPLITQLNEAGLPFLGTNVASDKAVWAGITKVRQLLIPDPISNIPRLRVSRACTQLIREAQIYQFRRDTAVDDESYRERLRNIEDDWITCLRYGIMAEPLWNLPEPMPQQRYDPDSGQPVFQQDNYIPGLEV